MTIIYICVCILKPVYIQQDTIIVITNDKHNKHNRGTPFLFNFLLLVNGTIASSFKKKIGQLMASHGYSPFLRAGKTHISILTSLNVNSIVARYPCFSLFRSRIFPVIVFTIMFTMQLFFRHSFPCKKKNQLKHVNQLKSNKIYNMLIL